MTIIVTGGGLIAAHAARALADAGERVVIYDIAPSEDYLGVVMGDHPVHIARGDIMDLPQLMRCVAGEKADAMVHTAAFLPGRAAAQPLSAVRVNVEGTVNALEASRLAGLRRFVLCSTIGIYDQHAPVSEPWNEDHPIGPDSFYGVTKLSAEFIALHYAAAYGVDAVALRFCPVFGLGQWYDSGGASVMQALIEGPALGQPVTLKRRFSNTNQYLYAPDAADAILKAMKLTDVSERAFNIGSGELHTIPEVISLVEKAMPEARIEIDPDVWEESKDRHFVTQPFSLALANERLGFTPRFTMAQAIAHYADMARARHAREQRTE